MPTTIRDHKPSIVISVCLLAVTTCLCLTIYYLVAGFTEDSQRLLQFRGQLIGITLITTLLGSVGFFIYHQKKNNTLSTSNTISPIKNHASASFCILAVDDNPANLLIIKNYLNHQNILFISAASGAEAISIFRHQSVDLILMDIIMSGMDGIETAQAIRTLEKKSSSRIPIVAVSAHAEDEKKLHVLGSGFDDYIAKPVQKNQLLPVINRWCSKDDPSNPLFKTANTKQSETSSSTIKAIPPAPFPQIEKVVDIQKSLDHSNQNKALAKDMLLLLIQMLKDEKDHVLRLYQEKEWNSLYQLNHKIYGGSSYCGVPQLQQANKQVERLLQHSIHNDTEETHTLKEQHDTNISHAIRTLIKAMDELILWNEQYDAGVIFEVEE